MTQHVLMYVEKNQQHGRDPKCGGTSSSRQEQAKTTTNLSQSTELHQGMRVRVMVGHDVDVKLFMPEMIDTADDVEDGLSDEAGPRYAHESFDAITL